MEIIFFAGMCVLFYLNLQASVKIEWQKTEIELLKKRLKRNKRS